MSAAGVNVPGFAAVEASAGDTFKDVAERAGLTGLRGTNLYRLVKAEDVSADKVLVLVRADGTSVVGGEQVRQALSLKAGKIKVKPGDVGAGAMLFV